MDWYNGTNSVSDDQVVGYGCCKIKSCSKADLNENRVTCIAFELAGSIPLHIPIRTHCGEEHVAHWSHHWSSNRGYTYPLQVCQ